MISRYGFELRDWILDSLTSMITGYARNQKMITETQFEKLGAFLGATTTYLQNAVLQDESDEVSNSNNSMV